MYTLILTIMLTFHGQPAVSMIHLDGFKSSDSCEKAGLDWQARKAKEAKDAHFQNVSATFQCEEH